MTDDDQNPSPQSPGREWEVIEEVEQPAVENPVPLEDNNPNIEASEVPMSHTQDYAQQHLDHFEDNNDSYYQYPRPKRQIPYLLIGGILLGVVGIVMIAKLTVFKGQSSQPPAADILIESTSGSPTPEPIVSPTPTPDSVDKAKVKIQVLNGSGIVGAAGKLAQILKDDEWEKVDTSNAQSYDATGVRIQVKDGQSALADALEKVLADDYEDITTRETLDEDSDYNAVITLGKQPKDKESGNVQGASDSADLKQPSDKKE